MTAEFAIDWLTRSKASKLLRLYLAWPLRFEAEPEAEAGLFYDWLRLNYADLSVVRSIRGSDDVANFLSSNPEVVEAAKFLKPAETRPDSVRRDRRVRTSTNVFVGVYECDSNPALIGQSLKGTAFDVTPSGLGVDLEEQVPVDAILNITVAPSGYPIVLYRMTGEVRWMRVCNGRNQHGIRMFDVDDAERWRDDFACRFEGAAHAV